MHPLRLLILGTGGMAKNHAEAFAAIPGVSLVAGIDTRPDGLAAFQQAHNIPHGFQSVQDALNWGEFDAVTNVTPDAAHYRHHPALPCGGQACAVRKAPRRPTPPMPKPWPQPPLRPAW